MEHLFASSFLKLVRMGVKNVMTPTLHQNRLSFHCSSQAKLVPLLCGGMLSFCHRCLPLPSANGLSWTRDVEAHCIDNQGQQETQSHQQRTGRLSSVHKSHPGNCCDQDPYCPEQ
jgi:hypothetical protein